MKYRSACNRIVIELKATENAPPVTLSGGGKAVPVVVHDVIGRIMMGCLYEPGLVAVWRELLSFEGDELYIEVVPPVIVGKAYGTVLRMYADATPIGVRQADGKVLVNPSDDVVIGVDDALIVIAEDNDTYSPADSPIVSGISKLPATGWTAPPDRSEKNMIVICGFRRNIGALLAILARKLGSESGGVIYIVAHHDLTPEDEIKKRWASFEDSELPTDPTDHPYPTLLERGDDGFGSDKIPVFESKLRLPGKQVVKLRHVPSWDIYGWGCLGKVCPTHPGFP
jgi:hypothetical protein